MRAVEAAADSQFRSAPEDSTPEQRRADAVGLLAERALAAGFADRDAPVSGSRAERYQVMLHVEAATLDERAEPGRAELDDGTRVSAETCRRLSCDAAVVEVAHAPDGRVLDVGRRRRTVPAAIRRALEARDRGCRFPGCGSRFCDAHHIRHWADGGGTSLGNTILLRPHHHRLLHEEGYRVELNDWPGGRPTFCDRRGIPIPEPAPTEITPNPVERLVAENLRRGVEPTWATCSTRHRSEDDVPLDVYLGALEGLAKSA